MVRRINIIDTKQIQAMSELRRALQIFAATLHDNEETAIEITGLYLDLRECIFTNNISGWLARTGINKTISSMIHIGS